MANNDSAYLKSNFTISKVLQTFNEITLRSRQQPIAPVLVIGDIIVDRTFLVGRRDGVEVVSYEGICYKKEEETISLGGVIPIAKIISGHCKTTVMYLNCHRGALSDLAQNKLSEIEKNYGNLRLQPIYAENRKIAEVTRTITKSPTGEIRIMARFEDSDDESLIGPQRQRIKEYLSQHTNTKIFIIADFDKGIIDKRTISFLRQRIEKDNIKLIVQPYQNWYKYKELPIHFLICREDQLRRAMEKEFDEKSPFKNLPNDLKFFISFPNCQSILIHDYRETNSVAYLRANSSTGTINIIEHYNVLKSIRRLQTRSISTSYYAISKNFDLDETISTIISCIAADIGSSSNLHDLPCIENFYREFDNPIRNVQLRPLSFHMEHCIIHKIYKSSCKIKINDAECDLPGIYTIHNELKSEIKKIIRLLSFKNKPGENITTLLLEGATGSGKGFIAEKIADALEPDGSKTSFLKIMCNRYGLQARGSKPVEEILQKIKTSGKRIIFLDEVDKFVDSKKECQSFFLEFLNSAKIEEEFIDALVIAAVSTNWEDDPESYPDFFSRFPTIIPLPTIMERSIDIPWILGSLLSDKSVDRISLGALEAIMLYKHKTFRSFLKDLKEILQNVSSSQVILTEHLPDEYDTRFGDSIIIEFS
jgi:ATPase family associated with various cellular activities (AAA)